MTPRPPQDPPLDGSLRPARPADLETVLTWVGSAGQMKLWGGPALPWPGTAEGVWAEMGASPGNTFALTDREGRVLGLGQVLDREGAAHLARIIVSAQHRGRGLGRLLCLKLIEAARVQRPPRITLNVYAHNAPALALYQSLGFEALPGEAGSDAGNVRMVLRVG